ncbi:hypothetical protein BCR34DRAFT_644309 [Clohesyomyces aquaticus]|uniref:Integral membrane protein n=1 Tax=Clohesyomyces aquaticus TaxID=1231657 RepID=A0A1Y1ZXS4_9PLEO|nr:hypothetical protein BCR34DRAFT_644309 [Clohesyomyces aquaticus]
MANSRHQTNPFSTTTSTTTTSHGPRIVTTSHTTSNAHITTVTSSPQSTTTVHPTITTTYGNPQQQTPPVSSVSTQTQRWPSIRVRRQSTDQGTRSGAPNGNNDTQRRSSIRHVPSQPSPSIPDEIHARDHVTARPLQTLPEEGAAGENSTIRFVSPSPAPVAERRARPTRPRPGRQLSAISLGGRRRVAPKYEPGVVDMLDVIDPEVSTLTTLNNVQNSLFIPNLGWLYRRAPTYDLSQPSPITSDDEEENIGVAQGYPGSEAGPGTLSGDAEKARHRPATLNRLETGATISSVLTGISEGHNYAVLPHGASLPGWTAEEKVALNNHVRHLLHSRRAKFKRGMRGFGRYVRKPVGFLVTLYAFLLTFWGAAWVLFIIGWISVGDKQSYLIEICDQILTALFCVVGIGFAPWRAVDTYHMIFVAHYAHLTWRLRKKRGLPDLKDRNELPTRPRSHAWESGDEVDPGEYEEIVLKPSQQEKLEHHQAKLAKSHTFYKPHETKTHSAFSLRLLIAIVALLDCHSLFQMALGGTTWGIYYKVRPKALTAVILSCSITCNISAGITISVGDKKSRKKLVVEQMFRQEVTEEALTTLREERGLVAMGVESAEEKKE